MMIPVMNVTRQYESIREEINEKVIDILQSGQYILGKTVEEFENSFAKYCNTKYAIGVGNGSDALVIALKSCGVKPGDEVITTDMSFVATAEAIVSVGAKPVFADCTSDTYLINPAEIEKKITGKTRAIIPVHLYGQCADMDAIESIAKKYNLIVIEDAAQAAGAEYKGRKAGSMGKAGCISFFPTKNLGCAGDGGMIVTDDESVYRQCKALRAHGSGLDAYYTYRIWNNIEGDDSDLNFNGNLPKYFNYIDGYNSRLDAIQAGLLSVKLPYLDSWNEKRRKIANRYNNEIKNPLIRKPVLGEGNKHIYYVYAVSVEKRDDFKKYLEGKGITSGIYFPVPFHKQVVFEKYVENGEIYQNAMFVAEHTLVLPMFPELTDEEIDTIINVTNDWKE